MGVADRPNQLDYEPALHRALRGAAHDWPRVPAQVLRVKSAAVTHLGERAATLQRRVAKSRRSSRGLLSGGR